MERTYHEVKTAEAERHAFNVLKLAFIIAPIVAGLDKFFNLLTDWTQYLAPTFPSLLNMSSQNFMYMVGVIEIIAGLGVALKPSVFANVVSVWLLGIIVNLFILGGYYDIALRDFGLSIGAFALGRMALRHERPHEKRVVERRKERLGHHRYT